MKDILLLRKKFGNVTGLRHCSVSDKSGEDFYHEFLNEEFKKSFEKGNVLVVDLDGNRGYSPSFIDESFGNLVYDFNLQNVSKYLEIKSDTFKFWEASIKDVTLPLWEIRRQNKNLPKKTKSHKAWWRFIDNKFEEKVWIECNKQ
ncbi:STAS-like domain-containing protein [Flavobacterium aquidurense]|uniref:DUF4325 domain-containing protein n=1 Tax=Flavobacterium aquidurense TaxID=362413 RepID=A0A0Q0WMU3_9FLAO|nr:STAS-like domain-containing protein [Flavobacterium aquidurense]KQB37104.1 hypothetical protein RC62_2270 [Flavobacterium aquidurense]